MAKPAKMADLQLDVDRIRKRLAALNLPATVASEKIGKHRSWLQTIFQGKTQDGAGSTIIRLADVLGCNVEYLYGGALEASDGARSTAVPLPEGNVRQAIVQGKVQAGAWLEVDQFFEPSEFVTIDVPPDFPNARFPVFDVVGDSMDAADILDGDRIVCWDIFDYPFTLREGDDVVVERRRSDLREWTVKRIFNHPDGTRELRPISTNPAHKPFRILPGEDGPENEIQIIAVVDRIIRPHRRKFGA